tara:strand:+ start:4602 stop:5246 length:645 start_codon:yes stop_codon:yes gene_type:complete
MKKLISYSIWGSNPTYTIGAIKNAENAKVMYPGWICRFYIADDVPTDIVEQLKSFDNTEIVMMGKGDWTGMFWRFYAASDPDVEVMISRDTDSRLTLREVEAVNEWLESDKGFHIMRDHPFHGYQIMGGMWGCKAGKIPNIKQLIDDYPKGEFYQVDQNFLREVIWPMVADDYICHDEYFEKKSFPSPRQPRQFVGQPFDQHDNELDKTHADKL